MTEIHLPTSQDKSSKDKPLWPVAAVILGVVFTPALFAYVIMLLRS